MEVTQENFDALLPEVMEAISSCDFLSFDCEFSGFGLGGLAILPYDTPALVYDKTKGNISNYTVMQFGLATFSHDDSSKMSGPVPCRPDKFRYRAFNFYVFPRLPKSLSRLRSCVSDQFSFSAQADCMDFLASQNFDFNKWIKQGIGYLREAELTRLCDELKRRYTWKFKSGRSDFGGSGAASAKSDFKIPEHATGRLKDAIYRVKQFVGANAEKELIVADINLQERRLFFQFVEKEYPTSLFAHGIRREDGTTDIFLRKCDDAADHDRMQQEKLNVELKELEDAAGFCKVIKAITESQKPILGHNMFHDLLHVIRAFCCPLPETYDQFKALIQERFRRIIDTKVLAGQPLLKTAAGSGMSLSDLHKKIMDHPFSSIVVEPEAPEYGYVLSKENLHEAGYDAFLTGFIFIRLANYLGEQKNKFRRTNNIPWDMVKSLMGKITPGRIVDLPYLSLATPDLVPDRRHVFHISFAGSTRTWTSHEIIPLFSPYGHVFINWIDDRSAFVSLKNREQAAAVHKAMVISDPDTAAKSGWQLRLVADFLRDLEQKLPQQQGQRHSLLDPMDEDQAQNGSHQNAIKMEVSALLTE